METYECQDCGWILATFVAGDSASCQRCGGSRMQKAEKSPAWNVVRCACGHKDVYSRYVASAKCPNCGRNMGHGAVRGPQADVGRGAGKTVLVVGILAAVGVAVWLFLR